jgi:hypothetical protein
LPAAPYVLTSKVSPIAGFDFVFADAACAGAAVPSAVPAIPAPVNFKKSLLSVGLSNMISPLALYAGYRVIFEAAQRRLKQSQDIVKREILTIQFSQFCACLVRAWWAYSDTEVVPSLKRAEGSRGKSFSMT